MTVSELNDAERINELRRLQNKVDDLLIARGDAAQDCLATVHHIRELNLMISDAQREMQAFAAACCEAA